jgi:hypothetical protein
VKDDQEMAAQSWESSVTLVVYGTGTTRAVTREKIQGASGTREEMKLQPTESKSKRL